MCMTKKIHINSLFLVIANAVIGLIAATVIGVVAWLIKQSTGTFLAAASIAEVLLLLSLYRWYNHDILEFGPSSITIKGVHLSHPTEVQYADLVSVETGQIYVGTTRYDAGRKYILRTKSGDITIWSKNLYKHIDMIKQKIK